MHERRPNDNSAGSGVEWTAAQLGAVRQNAADYSGSAQLKVFAPPPDTERGGAVPGSSRWCVQFSKAFKKGARTDIQFARALPTVDGATAAAAHTWSGAAHRLRSGGGGSARHRL